MSGLRKPYPNSMGMVGGTNVEDEGESRARMKWATGRIVRAVESTPVQPRCNCSAGTTPCRLYPAGRSLGRTGRCEGCAMGLHEGHE